MAFTIFLPMPNVTKRDLISETAINCGIYRSDARNVIEQFFDLVSESVGEGHSLEIRGFGTFSPKQRLSRNGRNLKTGELMPLPPYKSASFKFSSELKGKIVGEKISEKRRTASDSLLMAELSELSKRN